MNNLIEKYDAKISKIEAQMKDIETKYENKEVPSYINTRYNNLELELSILTMVVTDIKNAL